MSYVVVGGIYMCGFFKKMFIVNTLDLKDNVTVTWIDDAPPDAKDSFSTDAMERDTFIAMSTDLLKAIT